MDTKNGERKKIGFMRHRHSGRSRWQSLDEEKCVETMNKRGKKRNVFTFEVFPRFECVGIEKVKKTPEFFEGVLQRCAGNEESLIRVELYQSLVQQRIVIFQPMRLVHGQVRPFDAL